MDKTILIVDDDARMRELLNEYLTSYGFDMLMLPDGSKVLKTIRLKAPDLVILDIMLPERDGLEVLREIRMQSQIPVIMLTAKGEDEDRIVGLELGADDYLPKPFNPRELLARIKAVLRRQPLTNNKAIKNKDDLLVRRGGMVLNKAKQTLVAEGKEVELSSTEYKLLEVLMTHPNTVMSRDRLMSIARGKDFMAFDRSIDVHISKLRAKLETDPRKPKRIKTIWGTGYMFVDES
ncbi:MAG: response regulator [Deltaproteobacteria bacterium]|nr:MAG: response regulator [Deltaproteobacteria bacterium]